MRKLGKIGFSSTLAIEVHVEFNSYKNRSYSSILVILVILIFWHLLWELS
jgi:competence transcription factor ComK